MRAAYFTDFIDSLEMEQKRLEKVKKASGTDHLVAVMSGTYLQNGQPARENMASRMEKARQVGVEQILELPLYTCLSSVGIYGYSASNLLTNAEDIDLLVLETIDASYEQLLEITYLLYEEFSCPVTEGSIFRREKNRQRLSAVIAYTEAHYRENIALSGGRRTDHAASEKCTGSGMHQVTEIYVQQRKDCLYPGDI